MDIDEILKEFTELTDQLYYRGEDIYLNHLAKGMSGADREKVDSLVQAFYGLLTVVDKAKKGTA